MQRFLILSTLVLLVIAQGVAQDPVKVAAKQCKVVLDNDQVRVLKWVDPPHVKTPMHFHPAMVSVSFTSDKTRYTYPDGKTKESESKAGQATWSDPQTHSSENLSDVTGEVIQVELKKPAAVATGISASEDPVKVDPKHYTVEFQNDRVRVLRITYGPGEKSVMHAHPDSVAVFLTDGQTKMTLPDGKSSEMPVKRGEARWEAKGKHLPQNIGSKPFELVLVELK